MEITQLIAVLQEMAHNDAALREAVLTIFMCVCLESLPSLWVSVSALGGSAGLCYVSTWNDAVW